MNDFMNTEIFDGTTIGDIISVEWLASIAGNVLAAILILIVTLVVAGWAKRRVVGIGERHAHLDDTLFSFLGNIAYYAILIFGLVFILNRFGVQTASIIAVIGAMGLAVGLALQGTLSNFAAGVMIIAFRPFKLGDFVVIGGEMGTVKDIAIFTTELATLDNVKVVMPNAEIWGAPITNYSVYPTRRLDLTFGVAYDADLKKAEDAIRQVIDGDDRIHSNPEPLVKVSNLGDSSVDFEVRVWCDRTDYLMLKFDLTRAVKEAFDAKGIDIPFPTRTLVQAAE